MLSRKPQRTLLTAHNDQIDENSTLPCAISSIHVLNGRNTRRGFLERIINPLLSANQDRPYSLSDALREVSACADKLNRFGSSPPVYLYLTEFANLIQISSSSQSPYTSINARTPNLD